VKSIGVSNFSLESLSSILSFAEIPPAVNEIDLNPLNIQPDLISYMQEQKIIPLGHFPVAKGSYNARYPNVCKHEVILWFQEKYKKTSQQILLNWALQSGYVVIPKLGNEEKMKESIESKDFLLEPADVEAISNLHVYNEIKDISQWRSQSPISIAG